MPKNLQSKNWISLTQRARIIYVNKDLGLNDITYEDLVSEKYKKEYVQDQVFIHIMFHCLHL